VNTETAKLHINKDINMEEVCAKIVPEKYQWGARNEEEGIVLHFPAGLLVQ
jgi:hypothetical protein